MRLRVGIIVALSLVARRAHADDVEAVVVRGGKTPPGSTSSDSLARNEVRQLPGAFGDPFRAVEAVPGMTPVLSGLPYFYVRGAPPGNVGYYFDGVRVPYLFHFGLGPAVIHPALIAKTELHRGGYPASVGRYAGGVIESTAMPPSERLHGEGQLRLIDAGALVEAPFANGRGSALASARYSYTAALFNLLQSDTTLDYRDYQARVSFQLGEHDTISFLGFGAFDLASQRETVDPSARLFVDPSAPRDTSALTVERILFASEFHRGDLRWDHTFRGGGRLRAAATIGFDRTRVEARRAATNVMTAGRVEITQPVTKGVLVRTGADVVVDRYHADALAAFADDDDVVARQAGIFASRTDWAAGARVDAVITALPFVEVVPGLRFDAFGSGPATAGTLDPRLSARFFVTKKVRIVHAYGMATQPPSTPITLPGITLANLRGGLQRTAQTSAAVEVDVPYDFTATGGMFHNAFYNLNDALGTAQVELIDLERSDALLTKSRGSAYGVEIGLKRKLTNRIGGLLSYTLSRSERTAGGQRFISAYDRPHVLSAAASADLGRNWRVGLRFVTYSGIPQSAPRPAFPQQRVGVPPDRTPAFVRVDLRVEKRWNIGKTGWISFIVEALNATLSREVTGYACGTALELPGAAPASPVCRERVVGPVSVPSLGVEGGF
ncbi:MAG: TonB-dependent receptor plug domain-containing protein [Labilithrix sp.]|nr:TonB-dependent receptor plug domain-containing protein [Labilithrix sp.]MCW5809809.1 TonB-dependent receptor plug domain-containing protein [Labilithrix sp.]